MAARTVVVWPFRAMAVSRGWPCWLPITQHAGVGHGHPTGSYWCCVATASMLLVWPCAGHAATVVVVGPTWCPFCRSLQPLPSRYLPLLSCPVATITHSLTVQRARSQSRQDWHPASLLDPPLYLHGHDKRSRVVTVMGGDKPMKLSPTARSNLGSPDLSSSDQLAYSSSLNPASCPAHVKSQ
jgi:hypothetical protein